MATGANDATPDATHKDSSTWEQAASRVMYCFASSVTDQLLSYIRDVVTDFREYVKDLRRNRGGLGLGSIGEMGA